VPKIPTYSAPQVEERALPGARQSSVASPSLFGAEAEQTTQTGKSLMNAGSQLGDIAVKMQERENADMVFRAETALKDDYLKFEEQTRSRKGVNAWGVLPDTQQWFADQEKKHSELLQNDAQRYHFGKTFVRLRQTAEGQAAQYEVNERRHSQEEAGRASIASTTSLAAASADSVIAAARSGDDTVNPIGGLKLDVLQKIHDLSRLGGWTPERRQFEESQHLTNFHKQVIQNMVDKDPAIAKRYFETNKGEINGGEYDSINRVLQVGETKQAGFEFANRQDIRELNTVEQRIAAARDFFKDEPAKRESAIAELKLRENERIQFRERGQKDAADQAWRTYAQSGDLKDIPSTTIAAMDGKDLEALRKHAELKLNGTAVRTDPVAWLDVRDRILAGEQVDLRKHINEIAVGDIKELEKLQTKDADIRDAATLSQQLGNTHDLMKWGGGDKAKKGMFDKAATDAINIEQQRLGKKLNYEQRQQIIDKMLIQGKVDGSGWFSDSKTYYEVAGTRDAAKFEPKPSKEDKQAIVERYTRRNGAPPNDAQISAIYKTWKGF
jgi:hypothetical protein